jgi:AbrB family looped-hinge helix DNA binding protein
MDILWITAYLSISEGYLLNVEIRLKLRRVGNSIMIAIPSQVVEDLNLKAGENMLLDIKDRTIVIRKQNS